MRIRPRPNNNTTTHRRRRADDTRCAQYDPAAGVVILRFGYRPDRVRAAEVTLPDERPVYPHAPEPKREGPRAITAPEIRFDPASKAILVTFPYHEEDVAAVKSTRACRFNPEKRRWKAPPTREALQALAPRVKEQGGMPAERAQLERIWTQQP